MTDPETTAAQLMPTFGHAGLTPDHLLEAMRGRVDSVAAWVSLPLTPWEEGVEGEPHLELAVRFGRRSGSVESVELLEGQARPSGGVYPEAAPVPTDPVSAPSTRAGRLST